ncbi:MAG: hypothetical protein EXR75_08540 [Myxococcales bacterium]|nr:hypothetical protein [Myxococcales bacterium]
MAETEVVRGERSAESVSGRLTMLVCMSMAAGALPIPILPGRILRQLRGALVFDVAGRYGLSLTADARSALVGPVPQDRLRSLLRTGIEIALRRLLRRFVPFAPLGAAATAFEVYALGHLLERYVRSTRRRATLRIQTDEAAALRRAIDEATLRAFHPETSPRPLLLAESAEDLRDEFTRWLDTVVLTGASLPNYVERRLDAAFDEIAARSAELTRGD